MDFLTLTKPFQNEYELTKTTTKAIVFFKKYLLVMGSVNNGIICVQILILLKNNIKQFMLTNHSCKNCYKVLKPINIIVIQYRKKLHMLAGHDPLFVC